MAQNGAAERSLELRRRILEAQSEVKAARTIVHTIKGTLIGLPSTVVVLILAYSYVPTRYMPKAIPQLVIAACAISGIVCASLLGIVSSRKDRGRWTSVAELELELSLLYEEQELFSSLATLPPHGRRTAYRERTQGDIWQLRKASEHYRRIHNAFQSVIIIGSLATSTVAGLSLHTDFLRWAAVTLSFAVGVSAGFTGYFKFRERSFYLQQTADAIEFEWNGVELGTGRYKGLSDEDAMRAFAEEVERIRAEQKKREQSLDQPTESKETP